MNYRHAFHAGNFADVLKHAVFAWCLRALARKPAPLRVIDTHAGLGLYDLEGPEAQRSPEWQGGIGRLWDAPPPPGAEDLLAPWLDLVRAENPEGTLRWLPGSAGIAASLARPGDVVRLVELHPEDARRLADRFWGAARGRGPKIAVEARDGYGVLEAYLPPPERRGLILVDPPFERPGEFADFAAAIDAALARFATGTYVLWRPLKDLPAAEAFDAEIAWLAREKARLPAEKLLRADLWVAPLGAPGPLAGAGVLVINPPFGLETALGSSLPVLAAALARAPGASSRLDRGPPRAHAPD